MERKQKSKCVQEELQTSVEKRATKRRGSNWSACGAEGGRGFVYQCVAVARRFPRHKAARFSTEPLSRTRRQLGALPPRAALM